MDLIVDTNAISAIVDGDPEIATAVSPGDQTWVPAIVLGEYRFGLLESRRRAEYETWLEKRLRADRVLAVDAETAAHYAHIRFELRRAGRPIPVNDLWIAALCRQHGHDLLSRDKHSDLVAGLRRISW